LGGHDHKKLYAAFSAAAQETEKPSVILVKTLKGDGLGPSSEERNTVHQKKLLSAQERIDLGHRLGIPLDDKALERASLYRPDNNSDELRYLLKRWADLGGPIPQRTVSCKQLETPSMELFKDMLAGSGKRELSTTMIPLCIYYSMFGFQRAGDMVWACGDMLCKGMYLYRSLPVGQQVQINLLGSGALMMEVIRAAEILETLGFATQVWSVTSYNELLRDALSCERSALVSLHKKHVPYLVKLLENESGIFVAVSDYMKVLPQSIHKWIPGRLSVLGTDGYGLSESRVALRNYFEASAEWVVYTALVSLAREGMATLKQASSYARDAKLDLKNASAAEV